VPRRHPPDGENYFGGQDWQRPAGPHDSLDPWASSQIFGTFAGA
jgi:hypothetical protein